jgi:hypothetical protein
MGIAIPEEFRGEMAMAGDWKTVSQRVISESDDKDSQDQKLDAALNVGVRKRKYEGQEVEEEAGERVMKKGWGSTTKSYPGFEDKDDDLDALLSGTKGGNPPKRSTQLFPGMKVEEVAGIYPKQEDDKAKAGQDFPEIKKEEDVDDASLKAELEDDGPSPAVVFKKRKLKASKDK